MWQSIALPALSNPKSLRPSIREERGIQGACPISILKEKKADEDIPIIGLQDVSFKPKTRNPKSEGSARSRFIHAERAYVLSNESEALVNSGRFISVEIDLGRPIFL